MVLKPLSSHLQTWCCYPSRVVLLVNTIGASAKHLVICCRGESSLLSDKSCIAKTKQALFYWNGLTSQSQFNVICSKEIPHERVCCFSFIGQ